MAPEKRYWDPEHETMSRDQLAAYQLGELRRHITWACERTRFYRESFDRAGVRPSDVVDFDSYRTRVPFASKEAVIEAQQKDPPFGGLLAVPTSELARIFVAPGPIYMPLTAEDGDKVADSVALALWAAGVRPGFVVDVTTNYHWVIAGTMVDSGCRRLGCVVIPGGVGNTKMHLEAMKLLKVNTVVAFATYFVQLAEMAKEMGIDLRKDLALKVSIIGGELVPKQAVAELEEMYGMTVRENYGTADLGTVGFECEARAGLHLQHYHLVEVLDPVTHEPVPEGHGGELVVTSFLRKAMPAIRHRTGDIVAFVNYEPCSCGRNTPRLGPIVGRVGNIPKVKGMFVVPKQIENALYPFNGLGRFQMIIDRPSVSDVLTVRIEAASNIERAAVGSAVAKAVREAIRIGAEIEFVDSGVLGEDAAMVIDKRQAAKT